MKPGSKENPFIFPQKAWEKYEDFIKYVFEDQETIEALLDEGYKLIFETAKLNKR